MPNPQRNARAALLDRALRLPQARDPDFRAGRAPAGVDAAHLRVINDTQLRTRLIAAGLAEGLQSPKGPQKMASIIRVYPDGDAPGRPRGPGGRPPGSGRSAAANGTPPRAAYGLPSVEEIRELVARIDREEHAVSEDLQGQLNADIDRRKREIGTLEGEAFEAAFRELDALLQRRRQLSGQVREEAFRRIDADEAFEPRRYLRLLAREPRISHADAPR